MPETRTVDLSRLQPGASADVRTAEAVTQGEVRAIARAMAAAAEAPEEERGAAVTLARLRAFVHSWTLRHGTGDPVAQPRDLTLADLDRLPHMLLRRVLRAVDAEWQRLFGDDDDPNTRPASS